MTELFRGIQWVVSPEGIEAPREGGYWIERNGIAHISNHEPGFLGWPIHLAEKEWVHLSDFEAAFRAAVSRWAPDLEDGVIARSFARAREIREGDGYPIDPPLAYPLASTQAHARPRRRQR